MEAPNKQMHARISLAMALLVAGVAGPAALASEVIVDPPAPVAGKSVVVGPLSGTITGKPPDGDRFQRIDKPRAITLGWTLNARRGTVGVTSASDDQGGTQTGEFYAGLFKIGQRGSKSPVTELTLAGGDFDTCSTTAYSSARSRRRIRRLWSKARGRFRTRGRFSSTSIRGTTWLTEDRCDGTLTVVRTGKVTVRDLVRDRTVTLKAGQRYLAKR